jgi:hypothetical protein
VSKAYTAPPRAGRAQYDLRGRKLDPRSGTELLAPTNLVWHREQVFKGQPLATDHLSDGTGRRRWSEPSGQPQKVPSGQTVCHRFNWALIRSLELLLISLYQPICQLYCRQVPPEDPVKKDGVEVSLLSLVLMPDSELVGELEQLALVLAKQLGLE